MNRGKRFCRPDEATSGQELNCKTQQNQPAANQGLASEKQNALDAALAYAAAGVPVFPCGSDKQPLTKHGFKDAATDEAQIKRWWRQHPDALIGSPTGRTFSVLDIDCKNGKDGFAGVPDWQSLTPVIATTRSGGKHLYFEPDPIIRSTSDRIAPGVDTRGGGGYVILPGSTGYSWVNGHDLSSPLPEWPDKYRPNGRDKNPFEAFADSVNGYYEPRFDMERGISSILEGSGLHENTARLASSLVTSGLNSASAERLVRAVMDNSAAPRDERFRNRYDDIPRLVQSAKGKFTEQEAKTRPPLKFLDMTDWDYRPFAERRWVVENRVPVKQAGYFSGEGGSGKSYIELMRSAAHVLGREWLGAPVMRGPVIYICAEDDVDELHRRLAAIAKYYNTTFVELVAGGLNILPMLGEDATLVTPARSGRLEATPLYHQIAEAAGDFKAVNVSIDTLSCAYGGSEIDRVQVYAFRMFLQKIAMVTEGAITLLAHPSLMGISSGSGISGNRAWHDAFRFRYFLKAHKSEGDEDDGGTSDLVEIEFMKNQYGRKDDKLVLRWHDGLFVPAEGVTDIDRAAADMRNDAVFIETLRKFADQGRNVSAEPKANNYAPTAFSKEVAASKGALEKAMGRLFNSNRIKVEQYGRPSQPIRRIVER